MNHRHVWLYGWSVSGCAPLAMAPTLVDGVDSAHVPITDRGLMYGDGLFETIAVRGGRPCAWTAHLRRLREGAGRLSFPCPPDALLLDECERVIGGEAQCVVKIVLTRGSGGRGYRMPARQQPTRILSRNPWPDYPESWVRDGVSADFCRTTLGEQPRLAGLKHLNRLEQVLARSEWDDRGRAEGLMCDGRGRVICGTMTNLFVVNGGVLATPRLNTCGIAGTVRAAVLKGAERFALKAVEKDLYGADIEAAEGLFLTNALIGVWPVRSVGKREYDLHHLPFDLLDAVRAAVHQPDQENADRCGPC